MNPEEPAFPEAIAETPRPDRLRLWLPALCALGGAGLFVARFFLAPASSSGSLADWAAVATGVIATIAAIAHRAGHRTGWFLIAAGFAGWSASAGLILPDHSAHTMLVSAGYLLFVCAVSAGSLWIDRIEHGLPAASISPLDYLPVFASSLVVAWTLAAGEIVGTGGESALTAAIHAVGFALLITAGTASVVRGSRVLGGALIVLAAGDALWTTLWTNLTDLSADQLRWLPVAGFALVAVAAAVDVIQSRRPVGMPGQQPLHSSRIPFALQYLSLGALLLLDASLEWVDSTAPYAEVVADLAALGLLLLIVARQMIAMRQERSLEDHIGSLSLQLDTLVSQVGRDPLTGLLNHRAVHERLELELIGGRGRGESVAIALIDVDNFKTINDTLGHQAGDRVLRAVSTILVSACRASDVAARYAGDEFMLILPGLDEHNAGSVCDRISQEVRRLNSDLRLGGGLRVTLSVGVAVTHHCYRNVVQNVAIADAAMYDAKEGGKNQVVVVNADTLQIMPTTVATPSVDQLMAESRATADWAEVASAS